MVQPGIGYNPVRVSEDHFGFLVEDGASKPVRRFTWQSDRGLSVQVITYGATITSIKVPDAHGVCADIVMGFDDMNGYLGALNPYFGATVGRVANRIGGATINIDGATYRVTANLGKHQLHGGRRGFDKVLWDYYIAGNQVVLSYVSDDGEEGFPGAVLAHVVYELTADDCFHIEYKCTASKPTFVNLTNHSYFNLAGHDQGADELYQHTICINADRITRVDADAIPDGTFLHVADTPFDLRVAKRLGDVIDNVPDVNAVGGFDHNFCVSKATDQTQCFIARVAHPRSGRALELYSNQPGVQFYTSNSLPKRKNKTGGDLTKVDTLYGKNNATYCEHGALCLETQNYPDAINHKNFPKATLYPGEIYHHTIVYKLQMKQQS